MLNEEQEVEVHSTLKLIGEQICNISYSYDIFTIRSIPFDIIDYGETSRTASPSRRSGWC